MASVLLLVDEAASAGSFFPAALKAFGGPDDTLDSMRVACSSAALLDSGKALLDRLGVPAFSSVWSVSSHPGFHTPERLAAIAAATAPGGKVVVEEPSQDAETLKKAALFSGLANCTVTAALAEGALAVTAQKPSWETGSKQLLRRKPAGEAKAKVWTIAADDEDDEIIDDNDLLTEDDLKRPVPAANDDCEIGKGGKKACKNCTCGRAEGAMTDDQVAEPQSACGSCYLGDAFRCSTCPYRGMPAFKPGEKIQLQTDIVDV